MANGYSSSWTTSSSDKSIKAKYTKAQLAIVVAKKGTRHSTKYVSIYNSPYDNYNSGSSETLVCPSTANINTKFRCQTNVKGYTISASDKNLASGYASSFTTTYGDMSLRLKYTESGTITVYLTKDGVNKVTGYVSIVDPSSSIKQLNLTCPTSAKVGEQFRCSTSITGATLKVSTGNLASGYSSIWTTTANDKIIKAKYTKTGTATVTISKSGYNTITKKVKIN